MALLARLKKDYKYHRAVLFSGREFVKAEWRRVPAEFEAQALSDERIETKKGKDEPMLESAEPIEKPEGKSKRNRWQAGEENVNVESEIE